MKILHVIPSLSPRQGGPPKACVEMAQAVAARGHQVDIFTTDHDGPHSRLDVPIGMPVEKGGVNIYYFRAEVLRGWPCVSLGLWRALRDRVPEYDIVHEHSFYHFDSMVSGYYCRKYGVPYLIRTAGTLNPFIFKRHRYRKALLEWLYERRNLRHAAAVHFSNDEEMRLARKLVYFDRGVVAPNGLHLEEYTKLPVAGTFRRAFPEVGDKKIILFFGRINFLKGLDLLVPAFARIARERGDVHLVLAGPDNEGYAKKVKTWVRNEGMEERVTFTGMLQGELKLALLRESEMLVVPSYGENFGIAVIEAMACSLPVLISNKINICHEVKAADAGMVVECDVTQITDAMHTVLDDPVRAAEMGHRGRRLVEERYSWPRVAEKLEGIYQSLLTDKSNEHS